MNPEYLNKIAIKYSIYKWKVVAITAVSFGLLIVVSAGFKGPSKLATVLSLTLAFSMSLGFFVSGFLFQFEKLRSNMAVFPIWYYLLRGVEWVMGIFIIVMLLGLSLGYPALLVKYLVSGS